MILYLLVLEYKNYPLVFLRYLKCKQHLNIGQNESKWDLYKGMAAQFYCCYLDMKTSTQHLPGVGIDAPIHLCGCLYCFCQLGGVHACCVGTLCKVFGQYKAAENWVLPLCTSVWLMRYGFYVSHK